MIWRSLRILDMTAENAYAASTFSKIVRPLAEISLAVNIGFASVVSPKAAYAKRATWKFSRSSRLQRRVRQTHSRVARRELLSVIVFLFLADFPAY